MQQKKKRDYRKIVAAVSVSILVFLSACSNVEPETNEPPKPSKPANASDSQTNFDPLGKYDPPIEVKIGRTADNYKFEEGKSIDNNHVYDFYEEELGVKLKNEWVVPSEQYAAKSNVSISSGNIPDMFWVDSVQLRNLVEADMIEDLSEVYRQYVSETRSARWRRMAAMRSMQRRLTGNCMLFHRRRKDFGQPMCCGSGRTGWTS